MILPNSFAVNKAKHLGSSKSKHGIDVEMASLSGVRWSGVEKDHDMTEDNRHYTVVESGDIIELYNEQQLRNFIFIIPYEKQVSAQVKPHPFS